MIKINKINNKYTYADYIKWPENERLEIINGAAYDMTPAPKTVHQRVSVNLTSILNFYLKGKTCKVFAAPFDVILLEAGESELESRNVVQPDISVICDKNKIKENGCVGSPDLIVEILSPATASKDIKLKFELYERHGVKEYWIVHPADKYLMVYKLDPHTQKYGRPDIFLQKAKVKTAVVKGLSIKLDDVFEE
jgi:Uma2 family endonuclease